jgi:hypothetical protein
MPSYIYRRQFAPSQTRETLDEVSARLIEELRLRTEERVNHWNQLGDWCRQCPGRYIGVEWRPDLMGSSSSATSNTNNSGQANSGVETEELNFESSAELGDRALNEFWDLWEVQQELQDISELGEGRVKGVVEQPD